MAIMYSVVMRTNTMIIFWNMSKVSTPIHQFELVWSHTASTHLFG